MAKITFTKVVLYILYVIFIFSYITTTLLEILYGFPSFAYVLIPSLFFSMSQLDVIISPLYYIVMFGCQQISLFHTTMFLFNHFNDRRYLPTQNNYSIYNRFSVSLLVTLFTNFVLQMLGINMYEYVITSLYYHMMISYRNINVNCEYAGDSKTETEIFIDQIQLNYGCCGYYDHNDWKMNLMFSGVDHLPYSCCPPIPCHDTNKYCDINKYYLNGCRDAINSYFEKYNPSSYGIGAVYAQLKLLTLLIHTYLLNGRINANDLLSNYKAGESNISED